MARSVTSVNRLIRLLSSDKSFDRVFRNIQAISVTDQCLTCRFQVSRSETNALRTLHGAYIAGVVDFISAVDLVSLGHLEHVTVNLGIECLKPGVLDSWVRVDSCVLNKGRHLAFCDVRFTDEASGLLIARGSHLKYFLSR
ncbi:hypothetical protein P879_11040 [Paragonimus westermani]|uniref:Uncharacterized protein n=2 Tax=Paragonimus westermani TaxID=34504 RepID=A0A8T0D6L1_9TREM|nr:acyl-coenzyme A thioesterase 13 [Paragonimus westermani]KAF8562624.1 hypothetical protein P879_11040 [Paragonimus westermani]